MHGWHKVNKVHAVNMCRWSTYKRQTHYGQKAVQNGSGRKKAIKAMRAGRCTNIQHAPHRLHTMCHHPDRTQLDAHHQRYPKSTPHQRGAIPAANSHHVK